MSATIYPAFEAALEAGDNDSLLRLYDAAMTQRTRAEDLVRGYQLALRVQAQEREATSRALEPAGTALRKAEYPQPPSPPRKPTTPRRSSEIGL